jgi:signal transduction histidine kinase
MSLSRTTKGILTAWLALVGGHAIVSLVASPGPALTAFGDITQCVGALFANTCLLWNAASPFKRRNSFWMLLALGCTVWLMGQLWWTYDEMVLRQAAPNPFAGDIVFFLHTVPWIAALALQPHARKQEETLRYGALDLLLLAFWWVYLYVFTVTPWKVASPNTSVYGMEYFQIYTLENLIFVVGLGVLALQSRGGWRRIYGHLFGAAFTYTVAFLTMDWLSFQGRYYTGGPADVLLAASFVWFGTAGILAHRISPEPESTTSEQHEHRQWPGWVGMLAVLSMPLLAAWSVWLSDAPDAVRRFRLLFTLGAIVAGSALVFLRVYLADQERQKLLRGLEHSLENLRRLQTQFVQSEKLASLGQLAAGAAHEINNPLTAILGFSDMLVEDESLGERARSLGGKIREQARRTKTLVTNLQSFARQVPAEKQLLDITGVLNSTVQLRHLDLRNRNIRIEQQCPKVLPGVRGDPNQLLQVFYHIIKNAVEAMEPLGEGVLTVNASRERGNVVIEFSDTGPGLEQPDKVFDPFYTTKAVGQGTGLGLSICYGIVQEHSGRITASNRPGGGATFRIELPAILTLFPPLPVEAAPPVKVS